MNRRVATGALLALSLLPHAAWAQEADAPLQVLVTENDDRLAVTFDVTSAFTERFRRRYAGGLTNRVLIRISWLDADRLVDEHVRQCEMRFDVWDETSLVRILDEGREQRRATPLIEEALQACGRVSDLVMVKADEVDPSRDQRVRVEVALNPVSEALVERARQFMSNPQGGDRRTFFGTLARLFRTREAALGETFTFQSQSLTVPRSS